MRTRSGSKDLLRLMPSLVFANAFSQTEVTVLSVVIVDDAHGLTETKWDGSQQLMCVPHSR